MNAFLIPQQFQHAVLPRTTHDELARQNFMQSFATYVNNRMMPQNKVIYEKVVMPTFEQEHGRSPQNRHEIRKAMQNVSFYRWWSALRRTQQEMMWESVSSSVDRQLSELLQQAQHKASAGGSLEIDPNFKFPAYQNAVDIHCMPGSYHGGATEEAQIWAGAVYDRGTYVYGRGWLGPMNDDLGQSLVQNYLKQDCSDWQPSRILDMGCSVGHSTLPYVDAYPDAEIHAIDVAAPMLRYGHARAEALGKRIHFSQQNAECTNFADSSFDLVVSHILLHEIPPFAIRNVMRECYRLLAPGGLMLHVEAPLYRHMDAYMAFLYDWQTVNNNEPFWSAMRDLDLQAEAIAAGFEADKVREVFVPSGAWRKTLADTTIVNFNNNRGTWFVLAATR
jgi:ubiquinone/menaquinone biosynthesis C-methylase UbiE